MKENRSEGHFCTKAGNCNKIIPKLISGSSTQVVMQEKRQALKTLNRFQGLSNFIVTQGFTLIELLVVILIIGVLAAVALPQYQKAVEKARMAEAIMAVEKIAQAQELYRLEHGTYTSNINDLVLDFTAEDGTYGSFPAKETPYFIFAARNRSEEQRYKAIAMRKPDGTKYALEISLDGTRSCRLYGSALNYEHQLCQNWAARN